MSGERWEGSWLPTLQLNCPPGHCWPRSKLKHCQFCFQNGILCISNIFNNPDIKRFLLYLALQENWNSSDHSEHSVMWVMWCGVVQHNLLPHYFFMVRRDKKPRIFHGDILVFLQTFLFVWVISHISCSERPLVQCCCKERRMRGHLCCVQLTAGWCIILEERRDQDSIRGTISLVIQDKSLRGERGVEDHQYFHLNDLSAYQYHHNYNY